jgi:hypothetical protein
MTINATDVWGDTAQRQGYRKLRDGKQRGKWDGVCPKQRVVAMKTCDERSDGRGNGGTETAEVWKKIIRTSLGWSLQRYTSGGAVWMPAVVLLTYESALCQRCEPLRNDVVGWLSPLTVSALASLATSAFSPSMQTQKSGKRPPGSGGFSPSTAGAH